MKDTRAVADRPKTRGELRLQRMWAHWISENADVGFRIRMRREELRELERLGQQEDLTEEALDEILERERDELLYLEFVRFTILSRCAWLLVVNGLAFMLVPLSDAFDNWMSSPDMQRR